MSAKKLMIYSTNGGAKTIDHNATTWRELQEVLNKNGVQYDGMKAVDNNKMTLENPDAKLSENFTNLFLYPQKTKSGAELSFSECRAFIYAAIEQDEEGAKAHFNQDKNYTNKSTADLRTLIATYSPASGSAPSVESIQTEAATKTKAVGKAKKVKEEPVKAEKPAKATVVKKVKEVVESVAVAKSETKAVAKSEAQLDVNLVDIIEAVKLLAVDNNKQVNKEEVLKHLRILAEPAVNKSDEQIAREMYENIGRSTPGIRF